MDFKLGHYPHFQAALNAKGVTRDTVAYWTHRKFKKGYIIAVGELVDCLPMEDIICLPALFAEYPELDTPQERTFGNYEAGRYGLVFENMRRLHDPVPFKSKQGKLIDLDPATLAAVMGQL